MNATMMTKQKEINMYIEECAKWKKELDNEAAENENQKIAAKLQRL